MTQVSCTINKPTQIRGSLESVAKFWEEMHQIKSRCRIQVFFEDDEEVLEFEGILSISHVGSNFSQFIINIGDEDIDGGVKYYAWLYVDLFKGNYISKKIQGDIGIKRPMYMLQIIEAGHTEATIIMKWGNE